MINNWKDVTAVIALLATVAGGVWVMSNAIADVRTDVRTEISALRSDVATEISDVRVEVAEIKGKLDLVITALDLNVNE